MEICEISIYKTFQKAGNAKARHDFVDFLIFLTRMKLSKE